MAIHRVVTIDIGTVKTRVCETDYKKKNPRVYKCVVFNTPADCIEDSLVKDKKIFADALDAELERADITCRNFVFTVNSSKILSREVSVPKVKLDVLPGILEGQKNEYFPMDVSEHELAYTILDEDTENNLFRLNLYAVHQSIIRNYFGLAEELNGKLIALDYTGNSIYQWVKKDAEKNLSEVEMYVQMNGNNTMVLILEQGVLALQRSINVGTANVCEALKSMRSALNLSDEEAYNTLRLEKLIRPRFVDNNEERPENMSDMAWLKLVELQDAITESLRPLVVNLNRVIEYYSSKNKNARIPNIKFFGYGTRLNGANVLISNEIGLPVTVVTELADLSIYRGGCYDLEQTSDLVAAIGASIETINFIGVQFDSDKGQASNLTGMLLLFIVALVAAALMIIISYTNYAKALVERDRLAKEYEKKTYINQTEAEYNEKMNTLNEVTVAHEGTYTYNEEVNKLIAELEQKLPTSTVVHTFSSAGDTLVLSVTVADKPTAAQFLLQLQKIPYISTVSTTAIAESTDPSTGQKSVQFTVTCTYQRVIEEIVENPEEGAENENK